MNEYVEETNENKYLTLVPTNDSKEEIKKKKKEKKKIKHCGLKSGI